MSDATGLTAEMVITGLLPQFKPLDFEITRFVGVKDTSSIIDIVQNATKKNGLIVHTFVLKELRDFLSAESLKYGVLSVDLLGSLIDALEGFTGKTPVYRSGLQHKLSESYFRGIDAIEYTINHDGGRDPDGLTKADIVLIGVSRTSKTPLSIFLSNQYSLYVANITIVLGVDLPPQVYNVDKKKVVGLLISPQRLMEIRKARMQRIDKTYSSSYSLYADSNHIAEELKYSKRVFTQNNWKIIDVTEKSIEETATEIISLTRPSI